MILDEPTAVLTPQEAEELFGILRTLQQEGMAIIFITHKLNEVLDVADRITVLRRGKMIETVPAKGATREGLARLMVGREVLLRVDKTPGQPKEPLLTVENLSVLDDRALHAVSDVSFQVRAGEIVGIAGVDGNGQSELIDAVTGLRSAESGRVVVGDKEVTNEGARAALDAGVGPHPRGPPSPRPGARLHARREHRAARLQRAARLPPRLALPEAADRARPPAARSSSTSAAAGR